MRELYMQLIAIQSELKQLYLQRTQIDSTINNADCIPTKNRIKEIAGKVQGQIILKEYLANRLKLRISGSAFAK